MRFDWNGSKFRISFEHRLVKRPVIYKGKGAKGFIASRPETAVYLWRENGVDKDGKSIWTEINHVNVRRYVNDKEDREQARKAALRRLTKFVEKGMRETMWKCYLSRKEPSQQI